MTAHISQPFIHVEDANGLPIVGAVLYVYQVGTTTLASIYSDTALSVAVTNPLSGANASDASGNFPRVYLAAGTYKLRAETSSGTLIWQYDNIDTGLNAGSGALAITGGGTSATTAAGARTALGAAAQTDVDALSTQVTSLSTSLQNIVSQPQGRLTLTSGTPVLNTGVTAGTSVYYTPYTGNQVPIWDGTQFIAKTFAELTLTLAAQHLANSIYDIFIFLDGSTVTVGTGPAWTTVTVGSGSRGTGAGTTELELKNGLWTNKVSITARNSSTTYTVDANKATYVGSMYMDGSNGQVSCLTAYGQSRKWGIWNAYNRVPLLIKAGDGTASWTYNTNTFRASRNDSTNNITTFQGLREEVIDIRFSQNVSQATNNDTLGLGIGVNSTSSATGFVNVFTAVAGVSAWGAARYVDGTRTLGAMTYTSLERSTTQTTTTFSGTENSMLLTVSYRA